ncbi:hypothetical protein JZ751_001961 [Albula glossodonta]|uniref:Uncharacterized protein n=1 Tax=Albula glossodonta TaxID=121402 RepID=A0A8T2P949_9TELE|nr:hypothetical protein JZ751_001961 [Albula glossodonta]
MDDVRYMVLKDVKQQMRRTALVVESVSRELHTHPLEKIEERVRCAASLPQSPPGRTDQSPSRLSNLFASSTSRVLVIARTIVTGRRIQAIHLLFLSGIVTGFRVAAALKLSMVYS